MSREVSVKAVFPKLVPRRRERAHVTPRLVGHASVRVSGNVLIEDSLHAAKDDQSK